VETQQAAGGRPPGPAPHARPRARDPVQLAGPGPDRLALLDAFAGSGALGFEAASRGAAEVLLLERDPALVRSLQASEQRG
jgi:predicted RNA methylase